MDGISVEVIDKLQAMTQAAMTPLLVNVPERKGVYGIFTPGKGLEIKVREPGWHAQSFTSPRDMIAFITDQMGDIVTTQSAIFAQDTGLTLVYDLKDRRNTATLPLTYTDTFKMLMGTLPLMTQKEFVRLLRITLRGCLSHDSKLIEIVRNLKFTSAGEVNANLSHGNESLGKRISNQVMGTDAIPEEIAIFVQVYEELPDYRNTIRCAIEIFPEENRFRLTPYPNEIVTAVRDAQDKIRQMFEGDDVSDKVPYYYGTHNRRDQGE